jgi:hypothetical protein
MSPLWKGISSSLLKSILKDHLVNDLSAKNASPSEKFFTDTIEFFENHASSTTMTLHNKPPIVEFHSIFSNFHTKSDILSETL